MAYRRSSRTTRRPRRRTVRRRTTRTTRRSRPTRVRSSGRLTRRIANVASVKKMDNMANWVPVSSINPGGAGNFAVQGINPTADPVGFLFCPTARVFEGTQNDLSDRNAQTIFARGYREWTDIRMSGAQPFRWRRIVFSAKGLPDKFLAADPTFISAYYSTTTTSGYVRQSNVLPSGAFGIVNSILFKGVASVDWSTPMSAKVDTQKLTVHSDKSMVLNPGNQSGLLRNVKNWYPLNRNLTYGDDEAGTGLLTSPFASPLDRHGMGDLFIYDLFESVSNTADTTLGVRHQGTFFWHEKAA